MWTTTFSSVVANTPESRAAVWGVAASASGSSEPVLLTDFEAKPFLDRPVLYLLLQYLELLKI